MTTDCANKIHISYQASLEFPNQQNPTYLFYSPGECFIDIIQISSSYITIIKYIDRRNLKVNLKVVNLVINSFTNN
jgi:hypothetical protein